MVEGKGFKHLKKPRKTFKMPENDLKLGKKIPRIMPDCGGGGIKTELKADKRPPGGGGQVGLLLQVAEIVPQELIGVDISVASDERVREGGNSVWPALKFGAEPASFRQTTFIFLLVFMHYGSP